MQLPFILLSYGDWAKSKRLHTYNRDGINFLPVFFNTEAAYLYIDSFNKCVDDVNHKVHSQVCHDLTMAIQLFETIAIYSPHQPSIIVDPKPLIRLDEISDTLRLIDQVWSLDEVIDKLNSMKQR